jgi:SAM-dependent methyltransferase
MPFAARQFDVATLLHVGMNIPDKAGLFAEAARVLRPGGTFAVYDVMRFGRHPDFPVPWSAEPATSALAPPETYLEAARVAGFTLRHHEARGDVAKAFFATMQARMAETGPPVVGPPLLMGETAPQKVQNMVDAVQAGDIAPVEMVFDLPR